MKSTAHNVSRFGALALGAIALGCAALAAFIASDMMSSKYAKTKVTPVVVANAQLKVGEPIKADHLKVVDWPVEAVPEGAFNNVQAILDSFETVTPTVGILAGEPVVKARLSDSDHGTGVAALVEPNLRAVALEVDASVANTGLVYPGAFVDVIVTFRDHDGQGPSAYTAVQRAHVLSVGLDVDVATRKHDKKDKFGRRDTTYVTLQVTPEEAEVIGVARTEGRIDLSLRNGTDDTIVETPGARPIEIIPELEIEEEAVAGKKSSAKPSRRAQKRQRRNSRYRSRRIRLSAKPVSDTKSRSAGGIETYRAN